ncbi:hypothetical protein A2955_04995 [Candidatus Woesebacteria bacterium RIFCSPLOWO2_01_FULL_37_19]|uniref:Uncharacterized protein n=1 Tax=Candidatus Woesebacteria bacterium RIFCSPLOWO2_01_FULL_37_19 TaxID=1802514 RepID=A0A1F8B025_9BACT|nr:MAG: hypothetical protein A2955_04995 [Candidatus Woesebacteria bacterium RIFCSPLOWO2_01_FULL_37_19]
MPIQINKGNNQVGINLWGPDLHGGRIRLTRDELHDILNMVLDEITRQGGVVVSTQIVQIFVPGLLGREDRLIIFVHRS